MLCPFEPVATAMTATLEALARIAFASARGGPITVHAGPAVSGLLDGILAEAFALAARRSGRRVVLERCSHSDGNHLTIDGV